MADIWVATPVTATTINNAINTATAGDNVIIPDGTYSNLYQITVPGDVDGTEANPITLKPATVGGVTFTGNPSGLRPMFIQGDWWTIRDFKVIDVSEVGDANTYGIMTRDATGTRITNNYFEGFGVLTDPNKNSWCIWIGSGGTGSYSRVDHNTFIENEAMGVSIGDTAFHCQIDHNHFKEFVADGDNGFSAIQPGYHPSSYVDLYTTVEYNLFENMSADPETVSNKSSSNTYRYNVFKSTGGKTAYGLVLRAGADCVVDGNYFFDVAKQNIRVHGAGHKIINNYFENPGYFAILLAEGVDDYPNVSDILIANNTIIDPGDGGYRIGWWPGGVVEPANLTFKNNIIKSSTGFLVEDDGHTGTFVWENNLHYATGSAGYWNNNGGVPEPGSGITHADPSLVSGYGIMRLQASSSNAIEQGTPDGNVTDDIDGHTRDSSSPDIGCDEYSAAAPNRYPVTENDVGVSWLRSGTPYIRTRGILHMKPPFNMVGGRFR